MQDEKIRQYFIKNYKTAQVVRIEIERTPKNINLFVYVGQPGSVIGKEGTNIPVITKAINLIAGRKVKVNVNVIAYENVS
jgi:small subunit ribosomal protein S3